MLLQVTLNTDGALSELIADTLLAKGALAVTIENASSASSADTGTGNSVGDGYTKEAKKAHIHNHETDRDTQEEYAIFGEPSSSCATNFLETIFTTHSTTQDVINECKKNAHSSRLEVWPFCRLNIIIEQQTLDGTLDNWLSAIQKELDCSFVYEASVLNSQDWVMLTQAQFAPIAISPSLYIVPSWHINDFYQRYKQDNPVVIKLDPGVAFGTGTHATTRLCLTWLDNHLGHKDKSAHSLIDYGCGSGILAIAASKLGVKHVIGIDIDDMAIATSKTNAANNGITDIHFMNPEEFAAQQCACDIVIANILANPLRILAPYLALLSAKRLLITGILTTQQEELKEIYTQYIPYKQSHQQDGWVMLEFARCDES